LENPREIPNHDIEIISDLKDSCNPTPWTHVWSQKHRNWSFCAPYGPKSGSFIGPRGTILKLTNAAAPAASQFARSSISSFSPRGPLSPALAQTQQNNRPPFAPPELASWPPCIVLIWLLPYLTYCLNYCHTYPSLSCLQTPSHRLPLFTSRLCALSSTLDRPSPVGFCRL
jgi:hypothetical protein